jgi:iron complex transport system ATP-binding protein
LNLECRQIVAGYGGNPVLRGISLEVRPGEVLGLSGPNGAGKSTLLKVLSGRFRPISGEVRVGGTAVRDLSDRERARRMAVMVQGPHLEFPFTVREFVGQGRYPHLGPFRRPGPVDGMAVERALAETGLESLAESRMDRLSGGEAQRAWLARALCQEAGILLLDEPASALDVAHQAAFCGILRRLAGEGRAVVIVLHDLNLAARLCDRLLLLGAGGIVAEGEPESVLRREVLGPVYGGEPLVRTLEDGFPVVVFSHRRKS